MIILVNSPTKSYVKYEIEAFDTILSLKQQIQKVENLFVEEQVLNFNGVTLANEDTFMHYGISNISMVHLEVVALDIPTALRVAVQSGDLQKTQAVLSRGFTSDQVNRLGSDGLAPVHIAASKKAVDLLQLLHANGANLDLPSSKGETALHIAARSSDLPTAKWLIQNGANLNAKDTDGNTPLHMVFSSIKLNLVKYLSKSGAALDVLNNQGDAPVHIAASKADGYASIAALAEAGANIELKNSRTGETALLVAASKGLLKIVEILLKLGADPTTRNAKGKGLLDVCSKTKRSQLVKLLSPQLAAFPATELSSPTKTPSAQKVNATLDEKPKTAPQQKSKPAPQDQELEQLRAQQTQFAVQQKELETLRAMRATFVSQQRELEELRRQNLVIDLQNKPEDEIQRKVVTLSTQNRSLQTLNAQLASEKNETMRTVNQLRSELQKLKVSFGATENGVNSVLNQPETTQTVSNSANDKALQRRCAVLERQLETTRSELETTKSELESVHRRMAPIIRSASWMHDDSQTPVSAADVATLQTIRYLQDRVAQLQAVADQPNYVPFGLLGWPSDDEN